MAAQALYRKWRSQTFEEVIGQEHITLTLRSALRDGRMSHAYLFAGPRGTGKTSTARILAKAINCLDPDLNARPCNRCAICTAINEGRQLDLIEIDAASNRGIDEIRDLREKIGFRPNEARYKVYIIDEVHMLTKEAFNALLKTLEEPPPHAVFVLATTEPDRVPETVRSRCQRFDFRRIPVAQIVAHLTEIVRQEGAEAAPEALAAIARRATGSMRDAISLLDQLLAYGNRKLEPKLVEDVLGLVSQQSIGQLVDCLASGDAATGLGLINKLVAEGVELGQLVDQIIAYLRAVLFVRLVGAPDLLDLPQDTAAAVARQATQLTTDALLAALREFVEARAALRDQVPGVPQLPVEMAFLRALHLQEAKASPAAQASQPTPALAASPARVTAPATGRSSTAMPAGQMAPPAKAEQLKETSADVELLKVAQASWDRFLTLAGKRCGMKVQAALRSVRTMEARGHVLVLLFAHAFARDLVNQAENLSQVEALWEELLEQRVQVYCGLVGESALPPQPASSRADDEALLEGARELGAVVKKLI